MGYLQEFVGPLVQERRRSRRARVTCPATLFTLTGEFQGALWDMSVTGARFEAPELPGSGARAMLRWRDQKHACTVVWTDAPLCGLEFEEPINEMLVLECARLLGTKEEPIAELSNTRTREAKVLPEEPACRARTRSIPSDYNPGNWKAKARFQFTGSRIPRSIRRNVLLGVSVGPYSCLP